MTNWRSPQRPTKIITRRHQLATCDAPVVTYLDDLVLAYMALARTLASLSVSTLWSTRYLSRLATAQDGSPSIAKCDIVRSIRHIANCDLTAFLAKRLSDPSSSRIHLKPSRCVAFAIVVQISPFCADHSQQRKNERV